MKSPLRYLAFASILSVASARADALSDSYLAMFRPLPNEVPSPNNELTEAKINLGRMLYYETRISKGGKMSCNSCHEMFLLG